MTQPSGLPSSSPGSFRVDLERAPEAIRDLESALDELRAIRSDALALQNVQPGSNDSVSIAMAQALGRMASGPGSLVEALDSGIGQVQALIESLKRDHHSYAVAETSASEGFDGELR